MILSAVAALQDNITETVCHSECSKTRCTMLTWRWIKSECSSFAVAMAHPLRVRHLDAACCLVNRVLVTITSKPSNNCFRLRRTQNILKHSVEYHSGWFKNIPPDLRPKEGCTKATVHTSLETCALSLKALCISLCLPYTLKTRSLKVAVKGPGPAMSASWKRSPGSCRVVHPTPSKCAWAGQKTIRIGYIPQVISSDIY